MAPVSPAEVTSEVAFTTTWPSNLDKNPFSKFCATTHKDLPVYAYFTALISAIALRFDAKPVILHNTTCANLGYVEDYHVLCKKDVTCEKAMSGWAARDFQFWVAPNQTMEAMSSAFGLVMAEVGAQVADSPLADTSDFITLKHSDCGSSTSHAPIMDFGPSAVKLGQETTLVGHGKLDKAVGSANYELLMTGALGTMLNCTGDASQTKACDLPMGFGSLTMQGMSFPVQPGTVPVNVDMFLKETIPTDMLTTTTVLKATSENGHEIFCIRIESTPTATGTTHLVV
jgi:hypothetical protein